MYAPLSHLNVECWMFIDHSINPYTSMGRSPIGCRARPNTQLKNKTIKTVNDHTSFTFILILIINKYNLEDRKKFTALLLVLHPMLNLYLVHSVPCQSNLECFVASNKRRQLGEWLLSWASNAYQHHISSWMANHSGYLQATRIQQFLKWKAKIQSTYTFFIKLCFVT
jgi:hypothetical protein